MWLDDCRIPTTENLNGGGYGGSNMGTAVYALSDGRKTLPTNKLSKNDYKQPQGRFTPNLLVCDDMLNDGSVGKSNDHKWIGEDTSDIYGKYNNRTRNQVYNDKGTNSRYYDLDKWFDNILEKL